MSSDFNVKPGDYSDAGNAAVFSVAYKGLLAWCDALGWLYFNDKRWEESDHKAVDAATTLTDWMLDDARIEYSFAVQREADAKSAVANEIDGAKDELKEAQKAVAGAKSYLAHAQKSRNAARIRGMLDLAKPSLVVKASQLDADPFLLNTPGGTVDLRTGKLKPHDIDSPYLFCTHMTAAPPGEISSENDLEGHRLWYDFLEMITCHDKSLAYYLQLVMGMALIGKVYHEGLMLATGGGCNGKTTFFGVCQRVAGDYAGSIDPRVLTTDRQNKGAALATLRGKRFVIAAETEEGQRLSTSMLKQLASADKLVIEKKYHDPEEIDPSHTLVLFTNHLPRVGSTDHGTWRRLTVIPFNATIPEDKRIPNYGDILFERAGKTITSWMIQGAVDFVRNGCKLTAPDVVAEATEAYQDRENWLENFIDDRCIREPGARIGARELYLEYKDWATGAGEYVRREKDFAEAMGKAGYQKITPKNKRAWLGLRVNLSERYGNPWATTL